MKRLVFLFLVFALTACAAPASRAEPTGEEQPANEDYPDLGAAPELTGDTWLNVDAPLRLADLRGKVVLLDMWTFG